MHYYIAHKREWIVSQEVFIRGLKLRETVLKYQEKIGYVVKYSDIWEVGADRGRCTLDAFWESESGSAQWKMSTGILEQKKPKKKKNPEKTTKKENKRERERRQLKPSPKLHTEQYERHKDVASSLAAGLSTFAYCSCWNRRQHILKKKRLYPCSSAYLFWGLVRYLDYFCGLVFLFFFSLKGELTRLNLTFLPNLLNRWSSNLVNIRIPGIGLPDSAIKNCNAINFKFQLNNE